MDVETIEKAGKGELRKLCREASISYRKLTNDGMRAALRKLIKPDNRAPVNERFSDTPPFKVSKKVAAPSVLDMLKLIPAGDTFSVKEIAKHTGSTEATVRTIIGNCNSTAPSNARFHKTGLRFVATRGDDAVMRKQ